MTSMTLLMALGESRDIFVQEARSLREGKNPVSGSRKRIALLAALIAALLLAGCGAVYALRLERMKVGKVDFYVPTEYDAMGNPIPVETRQPLSLLGLQGGAHQQALEEWLAFTGSYDLDGSLAREADRTGSAEALPENHRLTYGCYTEEMSQTLSEISGKYDLRLLSPVESFEWYEGRALLDSFSLNGLLLEDTGVVYRDGYAHLDGTFTLNLTLTRDFQGFSWEEGWIAYHYSQKASFDPNTDILPASREDTQWDYTRADGYRLLLVLGPNMARIYGDLPQAFVSVSLQPTIRVEGEEVAMTRDALEQLAEAFDLSLRPTATTEATFREKKAIAQAEYQALQSRQKAEHEAMYQEGYQEFVQYRLETMPNPENLSYALMDLNGDGVEELIINTLDILSMKDGRSYRYFDLHESGVFLPRFRPCGEGIFEVWCEDFGLRQYYFYQAGEDGPQFLTGVTWEDGWYQVVPGGEKTPISEDAAREIRDRYPAGEVSWLLLTQFGSDYSPSESQDPYARYLDNLLARYGESCEYALMDVDSNGVEELITRENGESLHIHTLRGGSLWDMEAPEFTALCRGGILEVYREGLYGDDYWGFYQLTPEGTVELERVVRDPYTLYYGHVKAGEAGRTVTQEEAMALVAKYVPISLKWKPIGEYPQE